MKLDAKNRKIIYELDKNARQPVSFIAKKVGLSKQSTHYRINRLKEDRVIEKFLTIVNLQKLNLQLHKAYYRFQKTDPKREEEIIEYLKKNKKVSWLVTCEGRFDIAMAIHTKSLQELDVVLTNIENKFGNYFSERVVNTVMNTSFFPRKYLTGIKENHPVAEENLDESKIDNIDLKILSELSKDARMEPRTMTKNIKLTEDAIRKRIKRLEKEKIITGYVLVPNNKSFLNKYNITHHKILIHLQNYNKEQEEKFKLYCKDHPNIFFMNKNIGAWEMEIDVETESFEEYANIVREVKQQFSQIIKDFFVLTIHDLKKFRFVEY